MLWVSVSERLPLDVGSASSLRSLSRTPKAALYNVAPGTGVRGIERGFVAGPHAVGLNIAPLSVAAVGVEACSIRSVLESPSDRQPGALYQDRIPPPSDLRMAPLPSAQAHSVARGRPAH